MAKKHLRSFTDEYKAGAVRHREGIELRGDQHRLIVLETGSLSGRIFRRGGNGPAEGTRVLLRSSGDEDRSRSMIYATETDAGGGFSFHKLAAGQYRVLIEGLLDSLQVEVRAGAHEDLGELVIDSGTAAKSGDMKR